MSRFRLVSPPMSEPVTGAMQPFKVQIDYNETLTDCRRTYKISRKLERLLSELQQVPGCCNGLLSLKLINMQ